MNKKYVVTLTDAERRSLRGLVSSGKGRLGSWLTLGFCCKPIAAKAA